MNRYDVMLFLLAAILIFTGNNHLHGGVKGFNRVLWKGEEYRSESEPIEFRPGEKYVQQINYKFSLLE